MMILKCSPTLPDSKPASPRHQGGILVLLPVCLTSDPEMSKMPPMAEKGKKWPDNSKGKFYVDDQCIDCDACRSEAPDHFTRNDEHGYSFVFKQPTTPDEIARAQAALEACPVEAIGKDGE
jgi:ferredoxin